MERKNKGRKKGYWNLKVIHLSLIKINKVISLPRNSKQGKLIPKICESGKKFDHSKAVWNKFDCIKITFQENDKISEKMINFYLSLLISFKSHSWD